MRNNLRYILIVCTLALGGCQGCNKKTLPSLNETYRQNDKKPFGGFVAYNELPVLLNQQAVNISTLPLDVQWRSVNEERDSARILYILITKNLLLNYREVNMFLKFVAEGNDLFIAADYIQPGLLKGLHSRIMREKETQSESTGQMDTTFVTDLNPELTQQDYSYYYYPFYNVIHYEKRSGEPLGLNQDRQPNFVKLQHGSGRVFLHAAPRAFSNYFLLTGNNLDYYKYILSTLETNVDFIFWDEFYKLTPENRKLQQEQEKNFSTLRVFKKHASLMWAFWIAVAGILLFVLVSLKRKQRLIEPVPPKSNATIKFTEIIGRLYLQHKDNKNIAEKQITYFYEKIRKNYFIHPTDFDEAFLNNLAGKSGVEITLITELFSLIKYVQQAAEISDADLMALNETIATFNKKRK